MVIMKSKQVQKNPCCRYVKKLFQEGNTRLEGLKESVKAAAIKPQLLHISSRIIAHWKSSGGSRTGSCVPPLCHLQLGRQQLPVQPLAPQRTSLHRCLPRRNKGDYSTLCPHWLLARQLGCYGNFMVLIKFISSQLIKFCHYYYYLFS